jgi:hypothetical protein
MKTYIARRDRGLPLRFSGEIIGFSEDDRFILVLYRTEGGQYVGEKITLPSGRSSCEKHKAAILKTPAEIKAFFGHSPLAGELYCTASVDSLPHTETFQDIA